jgi:hypothetical protein
MELMKRLMCVAAVLTCSCVVYGSNESDLPFGLTAETISRVCNRGISPDLEREARIIAYAASQLYLDMQSAANDADAARKRMDAANAASGYCYACSMQYGYGQTAFAFAKQEATTGCGYLEPGIQEFNACAESSDAAFTTMLDGAVYKMLRSQPYLEQASKAFISAASHFNAAADCQHDSGY